MTQAGPEVGAPAPDFTLEDAHGTPVTLSTLRGAPVLLVFYPHAFTGTCTYELTEIREARASGRFDGVQLLGISCDPSAALRVFAEQERLELPLLSDFWPHGEVSRRYGCFFEPRGFATRGSFLVDAAGVLRWSVVNGPGDARDVDAYAAAVAALPAA